MAAGDHLSYQFKDFVVTPEPEAPQAIPPNDLVERHHRIMTRRNAVVMARGEDAPRLMRTPPKLGLPPKLKRHGGTTPGYN